MRFFLLAACCFGFAVLLAKGQVPGFALGEETVRFVDRNGRLTMYHQMALPDLPPIGSGPTVEGRTGPEPLFDRPGAVTIVTAWASWCHVCKGELPRLRDLQADLGVAVRPVSVEPRDNRRRVETFLRNNHAATLPALRDTAGAVMPMLDTRAVPASLIVDKYGQVVGRFRGAAPWHSPSLRGWLKALQDAQDADASRRAHIPFVK
ncbi:MAG: TlpA disulfide reductase family protein [Pseudomonadota bacterium]